MTVFVAGPTLPRTHPAYIATQTTQLEYGTVTYITHTSSRCGYNSRRNTSHATAKPKLEAKLPWERTLKSLARQY